MYGFNFNVPSFELSGLRNATADCYFPQLKDTELKLKRNFLEMSNTNTFKEITVCGEYHLHCLQDDKATNTDWTQIWLGKSYCSFQRIIQNQLCNFIEIAIRHGCSPVNLLHIFTTPFLKNTSGRLLLIIDTDSIVSCIKFDILWTKFYLFMFRSFLLSSHLQWRLYFSGFIGMPTLFYG